MKDIVWFIKPKNDTLDDLLLRMKDTASSLLADIGHEFETAKNEKSIRVTIDFKRNFFLAFKEILTNIVKHSSATRVQIQVQHADGSLEMVVRDNGRGFNQPRDGAARRGNGLDSLRSRASGIGGTFEISSEPGKGTTVRFSGRL
jgi:signal transduction histidine kinase